MNTKDLNNSSISELPGNKGCFVDISIRIAPIAHISTGNAYTFSPNKISGARYHKVTTSCVNGRNGGMNALAKPNQQFLIDHS